MRHASSLLAVVVAVAAVGPDLSGLAETAAAAPAPRRPAPLAGVGLVLSLEQRAITVVRVIGQAPACTAGIRAGDLVERIDGRAVASLVDAVARLAGSPGSTVTIGVRREGKTRSFAVRRAVLAADAVGAPCP